MSFTTAPPLRYPSCSPATLLSLLSASENTLHCNFSFRSSQKSLLLSAALYDFFNAQYGRTECAHIDIVALRLLLIVVVNYGVVCVVVILAACIAADLGIGKEAQVWQAAGER